MPSHVVMIHQGMQCLHCGEKHPLVGFMPIKTMGETIKKFGQSHEKCPPTWQPPVPSPTEDEAYNMQQWIEHGEHGISSLTMFAYLSNRKDVIERYGHPHDPSDFRRCALLLEWVPSWRSRLPELATISPQWANIVKHWNRLTQMMEANDGEGMYQLMQDAP